MIYDFNVTGHTKPDTEGGNHETANEIAAGW